MKHKPKNASADFLMQFSPKNAMSRLNTLLMASEILHHKDVLSHSLQGFLHIPGPRIQIWLNSYVFRSKTWLKHMVKAHGEQKRLNFKEYWT